MLLYLNQGKIATSCTIKTSIQRSTWKNIADANTPAHNSIIQVFSALWCNILHKECVGTCGVQDVASLYLLNQKELGHSLFHAVWLFCQDW